MPFDLARFVNDIGPEGLELYLTLIRGMSATDLPDRIRRPGYGRSFAESVACWPSGARRDLLGDLQRIETMSCELGENCLLQASPDRPRLLLEFHRLKSARQRALFCFRNEHSTFVEGEHRRSFSSLRLRSSFADRFYCESNLPAARATSNTAFETAVRTLLRETIGPRVRVRFQPGVIQPLFPPGAEEEFQFGIAAEGREQTLYAWGKSDPRGVPFRPDLIEVISWRPGQHLLTITGRLLKRPQRELLALLFAEHVLKHLRLPTRLPSECYKLSRLLSPEPLSPPLCFPGLQVGVTNIRLQQATTQLFADHSIAFGETVTRSLAKTYSSQIAVRMCSGASVLAATVAFDLMPSEHSPQGARFSIKMGSERFGITSHLDEHLWIASTCIEYWGMRSLNMPLFEAKHG